MIEVRFYDPSYTPRAKLTYSVIAARYNGNWIYVRHNDRNTWEIPGGHIEIYETPDQAASRELNEETGSVVFDLKCVATYSVSQEGSTGYGRLYFAEVQEIALVPDISEIAEIKIMAGLPDNLTYPYIQTCLFEKVNSFLSENS